MSSHLIQMLILTETLYYWSINISYKKLKEQWHHNRICPYYIFLRYFLGKMYNRNGIIVPSG